MRTCLLSLLTLTSLLGPAPAAFAHAGDEIYPFLELLDEDLARIDLTDGSVEDWYEVLGEPSLTATDFYWLNHRYDPSELDFRIWLAWHQASNTIWIAMERFDDLYFNRYDGVYVNDMWLWDSNIAFLVDGDHTAGQYAQLLGPDCARCTPERILAYNRQAQRWLAIAEAANGKILGYDGFSEWVGVPLGPAGRTRERCSTAVSALTEQGQQFIVYFDADPGGALAPPELAFLPASCGGSTLSRKE